MTTIDEIVTRRAAAFEAAEAVVRDWRALGKHTTTAGVTSVLARQGLIGDLESLGCSSNREFWEHAAASGLLGLAQQPNGHWLLLLPGEELGDVMAPSQTLPANVTVASVDGDGELRLKSDVWTSFVDWNPAYRRFWDRAHARAFMVPALGWVPEEIDIDRFVEIEPARQDIQIDWMRAFAEDWSEPDRTALLVALDDHAPRGAFRRELRTRSLNTAWRKRLRECILRAAIEWAAENRIDASLLTDTRQREASPVSHVRQPAARPAASTPAGAHTDARLRATVRPVTTGGPAPSQADSAEPGDRTALLRARLHEVIDRMDWDDLIKVPLRAEHLVDL